MSGEVKWIKLSTGIFDDEKIRLIETLPEADSILIVWMKLLTLAGKKNCRGEIFVDEDIPYTDELLATIFHRKINTVRLALETFTKFRMIEIQSDKTILLSNWAKYQNIEGLEKIREDAADRQRRHRLKQRNGDSNVTVTLPPRDAVTPLALSVTQQKKKKSENKELREKKESLSPENGIPKIETAEAKSRLSALAMKRWGRHLGDIWPDDLAHDLNKLVPIEQRDMRAVEWLHGLSEDDPALKMTARRQSPASLIRNFMEERDKALSVRRTLGLNGLEPSVAAAAKKEPVGWREFYEQKYPSARLPDSFWDLTQQLREEFTEEAIATNDTN